MKAFFGLAELGWAGRGFASHGVRAAGLCLAAAVGLTACAPAGQYYWGSYSEALYGYYRDATRLGAYRASLAGIIEEGEPDGRVPPSIYAELGFLELEAGNTAEARRLFEKEKARWPESAVFMDRMITAIDQADADRGAARPGGIAPDGPAPGGGKGGTS